MSAQSVPTSATQSGNKAARRSLILGIISVPAAMVPIGALIGIIAVAQGIAGIRDAGRGAGRGGQAIAGLVLGVIAIAMVVLYYTVGND